VPVFMNVTLTINPGRLEQFLAAHYDQRAAAGRQARGHVRSLELLGYKVTLEPVDPATGELTAERRLRHEDRRVPGLIT
jgi:hypothetical protein